MDAGFLLDSGYGGSVVARWIVGKPERAFLRGVKTNRRKIPVTAYRCTECGALEFYAHAEDELPA